MGELSEKGKLEVATALLLLKDFQCQGRFDVDITKKIIDLAKYLDVFEQYEKVLSILPPMKISPRYPVSVERRQGGS
jgi:hypothetical protein